MTPMNDRASGGLLFVLSGPSGVGKDAAIESLKARGMDVYHVITATTRQRRPNEQHGVDYFFYTPEQFMDLLKRNELLESAVVAGNRYGSPRQQVREQLAQGHDVLLKIDVQGARQVKSRVPDGIFIFLAPPSIDDLVERLQRRNTETADQIAERVLNAYVEMAAVESYDYMVVNHHDELEKAVDQINSIVTAERARVHRRTVVV
jgi:guanylate kinase